MSPDLTNDERAWMWKILFRRGPILKTAAELRRFMALTRQLLALYEQDHAPLVEEDGT